jgi:hypothetical protein
MMSAEDVVLGWARNAIKEQNVFFHAPSGLVGRVMELFDPNSNPWVDSGGNTFTEPVVRFEGGSTLVANPNAFHQLGKNDIAFFVKASKVFGDSMFALASMASTMDVSAENMFLFLRMLLQEQLRQFPSKVSS